MYFSLAVKSSNTGNSKHYSEDCLFMTIYNSRSVTSRIRMKSQHCSYTKTTRSSMFVVVINILYLALIVSSFTTTTNNPYRNHLCSNAASKTNNINNIIVPSATTVTKLPSIISRRNILLFGVMTPISSANAFSAASTTTSSMHMNNYDSDSVVDEGRNSNTVAYKTIALPLNKEFGITIPVACWFPVVNKPSYPSIKYNYRISLRRIGQLLVRWNFIPEIIARDFVLDPSLSSGRVVDGQNIPIPTPTTSAGGTKIVFLAHGFLGSRLDLAYIAEDLAQQGFVCIAPEYPESLEASYPRLDGLDRNIINDCLIQYIQRDTNTLIPKPIISYSAIGHSLGCSTVLRMGDNSWNRVLMGSGKAPEIPLSLRDESESSATSVGGRLLFISSINDGPVTTWSGGIQIPKGYTMLKESQLSIRSATTDETNIQQQRQQEMIPDRAALVFDREDAPNHISYLSANTNDAMLSFLSPLLPVTNALNIPVLDFDKYMESRDSKKTGNILKPLISNFLLSAQSQKNKPPSE